jgi:hypothetical protein
VQGIQPGHSIFDGSSIAIFIGVGGMNGDIGEGETDMRISALIGRIAIGLMVTTTTTACGHMMMMVGGTAAQRPAASEFGFGPRTSSHGLYTATLQTVLPLRTRQMQMVRVRVGDVRGVGIDAASITIDGGMPEHGHGLPTKPRVTKNLGDGIYEIEGVRFNMGGWWELTLAISTPDGTDNVTFNLSL